MAVAVLPLVLLLAPGRASSTEPTPAGLWQAVDPNSKEPTGWFMITTASSTASSPECS
jgi:hypothetical protein